MEKFVKNNRSIWGIILFLIGLIWGLGVGFILDIWLNPIAIALVVIGVLLYIASLKVSEEDMKAIFSRTWIYDERQRMVRYQAYAHGFFILAALVFVGRIIQIFSSKLVPDYLIASIALTFLIIMGEMILRNAFEKESSNIPIMPYVYGICFVLGVCLIVLYLVRFDSRSNDIFSRFLDLFWEIYLIEFGLLSLGRNLWNNKHQKEDDYSDDYDHKEEHQENEIFF